MSPSWQTRSIRVASITAGEADIRANDFGQHGQVGGMDPKPGVVSESQ